MLRPHGIDAGRGRGARVGLFALLVASVALLGLTAGCSTLNDIGPEICRRPNTEEPLNYCGGEITGDTYRSASWNGELLAFPGGQFYRIHHRLGVIPSGIQLYLSFNAGGVTPGSNGDYVGSIAQAAGNQAEIKRVTEEYVDIVNGSCIDYFLLAVIWGEDDAAAGGGGAGGAGGASGTGGIESDLGAGGASFSCDD